MGDCRLYKCRCGYEKQLMIGAGRSSQNLEIISGSIPQRVFSEFSREHFDERVTEFGMINSVISCPGCGDLGTVTVFSYTLPDRTVRYVSDCPNCGTDCTPLDDPDNVACPKCGAEMDYSVCGLWD